MSSCCWQCPARQGVVVTHPGIDPVRALGRVFLLPERGLGLQIIHQELAGLEGLAAVRGRDGDQYDLVIRLKFSDSVDDPGGVDVEPRKGRSIIASIAFSVMPG